MEAIGKILHFDHEPSMSWLEIDLPDADAKQIGPVNIFFLGLVTLYGLSTSVTCLWYTLYQIKLSRYIKSILIIITGYNTLACLCMSVAQCMFFVQGYYTRLSCQILFYPWNATNTVYQMTSLISMLRYYMTNLASRAKIAQPKVLIPVIILFSLLNYPIYPGSNYIVEWQGVSRSVIDLCINDKSLPFGSSYLEMFQMTYATIIVSGGVYCDVKMYFFVKSTHQNPTKHGYTKCKKSRRKLPLKTEHT